MKANDAQIIGQVQAWLKDVVIGLGLCPFAKPEFTAGRIQSDAVRPETVEHCIVAILSECHALDGTVERETSLLIIPERLDNFHDYLDVIAAGEASVAKVVAAYPNPEKIPERNIALIRKMGTFALQKLLSACLTYI